MTPVFSASYSGLFKSFFDVLESGALDGTPVLVAATAGTARHSLVLEHALRPLFSYLHAVVVPTAVFAASEDWGAAGADGALRRRIDRAAAELAALVESRPVAARGDQFDRDVAAMGNFEDLLGADPCRSAGGTNRAGLAVTGAGGRCIACQPAVSPASGETRSPYPRCSTLRAAPPASARSARRSG